jgi:hypothetical protein
MANTKLLIPLLLFIASSSQPAMAHEINFSPIPGVHAVVSEKHGEISYKLSGGRRAVEKSIDANLADTDTKLHLQSDDYLFNGTKGFAVMHLDEGKGTYEIYRVFTYSRKARDFVERFPACGDEFLNLEVNVKKKYLQSTYYDDMAPRLCITRLKPV